MSLFVTINDQGNIFILTVLILFSQFERFDTVHHCRSNHSLHSHWYSVVAYYVNRLFPTVPCNLYHLVPSPPLSPSFCTVEPRYLNFLTSGTSSSTIFIGGKSACMPLHGYSVFFFLMRSSPFPPIFIRRSYLLCQFFLDHCLALNVYIYIMHASGTPLSLKQ